MCMTLRVPQPSDSSIFITEVVPGGAADLTAALKAGDSIVSINGVSLEGKSHHDVVLLLKSAPTLHVRWLSGWLCIVSHELSY